MVGYDVELVSDGLTGLEMLRGKAFSAVILDLEHPVTLRRDLCVKIIALMSGLPVMVLSASPNPADRILFLEIGADDYVSLPFSPNALATRLDNLIRPAWGSERKESAVCQYSSECVLTATFFIATTRNHPVPGRHCWGANEASSPPLDVKAEGLVPDRHR
jgi:DNA-binding response OmpR family regulator